MLLKKSQLKEGQLIQITGSKSISNRLLILANLYNNIDILNLSDSQDTQLLKEALKNDNATIDIHHAGTAMRFLTSFFSIQNGRVVTLTGSDRMKQRPIKDLVTALQSLGAEINYLENFGFPPLKIFGKNLKKSSIEISANISSQFITSLMLIGAKLENGITIHLTGEVTSRPYLEMTLSIIKSIGIDAKFDDQTITINHFKGKLRTEYFEVESDWSSASYYYSLAAVGRKSIHLKSFKTLSLQGDSIIKDLYLRYFGIDTLSDFAENKISLAPDIFYQKPDIIEINMNDCPDIAQTLCVTAALLKIPFNITGLQTLKVKETDRLVALQNELRKIGAETEITSNSITSSSFSEVEKLPEIETYNDHRMAMAFAPAALLYDIEIINENVVEKSYPSFWLDFVTVTKVL